MGVSSIVEQYYRSSSSQTLSDGSWLTYNPGWVNGWFIWTRSVISYTNGTSKITPAICVTGSKGDTGNPGKDAAYIHVLGSGLNNNMDAFIKVFNGVSERTVYSRSRGLTVFTIERYTMELVETRNFDTYGSDDAINNMATYLNGLNATVFVCIVSYDAVGWNDTLVDALAQFGCAGVQNTEKGRFPFAFIGVKGLPAGYALMMQKNDDSNTPPAEVITYVADGVFATSRDGKDGKDGVDGKSPVLVFRGNYNASNSVTYYGTSHRVDAVKYNGVYYIARVDAGTFNTVPTDTSKWNPFGAQFESIATNLLLAEGASIGSWWHSGGKIVSTLGTGNKIELDASVPRIYMESSVSGGEYSEDQNLGSKIELNANSGIVRVEAKNPPSYSTGLSYMSPTGIFANLAGTQAVSAITGYTRKAAIVALGFGNLNKSSWSFGVDEEMIAGFYGVASNRGTAPAYGGFFDNLKSCGNILNTRYITDSSASSDCYISKSVSQVIGLVNSGKVKSVYLPNDGYEGRVLLFHQMGQGTMRVYPQSGQHIYDDDSENSYYDVNCGETLLCYFGIWYKNSVKTEVWGVSKFKF